MITEKRGYSLNLDMALDNGHLVGITKPASMAGSVLQVMESPLHLGLWRVTRRAGAKRRSRKAA